MALLGSNFVFIHVPRTGGKSITRALQEYGTRFDGPQCHWSAVQMREVVGSEQWPQYYSFAFVRNPWERLVSVYHRVKKYHPVGSFAEFLTHGHPHANIKKNQLDYMIDSNGELMIDFIGRFESLAADFDHVCKHHLNIVAALPHINAIDHDDYRSYYTPELRTLVGDRFLRDITRFGYRF